MISVCCVQISVQVAGLAEMQMALFNAKVALRQMTFIQTAPIVFPVVLMSFPKIVKCVRTMLIKVAITADIAIYVMKVLHQSITTLNFALHAISPIVSLAMVFLIVVTNAMMAIVGMVTQGVVLLVISRIAPLVLLETVMCAIPAPLRMEQVTALNVQIMAP